MRKFVLASILGLSLVVTACGDTTEVENEDIEENVEAEETEANEEASNFETVVATDVDTIQVTIAEGQSIDVDQIQFTADGQVIEVENIEETDEGYIFTLAESLNSNATYGAYGPGQEHPVTIEADEATATVADSISPGFGPLNDDIYLYSFGNYVAIAYSELMVNEDITEETFTVDGNTVTSVINVGPPGPPHGVEADEIFFTILNLENEEKVAEGTAVTLEGTLKDLNGNEITELTGQVREYEQIFSKGLDSTFPAIWSDVIIDANFDGDNPEHFDRKKAEFTMINGCVTVTEEVEIKNVTIRGNVTIKENTVLENVTILGNLIVEDDVDITEENVEVKGNRN